MKEHIISLNEHVTIVDGETFPYGGKAIEEGTTAVIATLLDDIVPTLDKGAVTVQGKDPARRMLGRKLEDRLGREVKYE